MWEKLVGHLESLAIITLYDDVALRLLCESWQMYLDAQDEIAEHGLTVEWKNGRRINPAVKIKNDAWKQIVELLRHFGLTPLARTGLPTGEEVDDTDESAELGRIMRAN